MINKKKIAVCLFGLSPFDDRKLAVSFPYDQFVGDRYHIAGKNYSSLKSWEDNILRKNVVDYKLVVGKDADIEVEYNSGIPQGW